MEANYRWERIQRLFKELEHEVTRGMLEREIDERIGFRFIVGISREIPDGVVLCQFESRPEGRWAIGEVQQRPRLHVIGDPSHD